MDWNDSSGDWQGLNAETQTPRYQAIAQIISQCCPRSVLDVGCGEALLWEYLPKGIEYFGVEPSAKAGESARTRCGRDCICKSTAEDFEAGRRRWDCVVFNEVLYYARHPLALLDKYSRLLRNEGIIIVSIYQKRGTLVRAQLVHWLRHDRAMSNVHCTRLVHRFAFERGWRVHEDKLISKPGSSEYWRIWRFEPRKAWPLTIGRNVSHPHLEPGA